MRLFLAIIPPPAARATLLVTMAGVIGARWQDDAQLHCTLAFLGDVSGAQAAALDDALVAQRARGFAAHVAGVSHFEDRGHPTALWARTEPEPSLAALSARVSRLAVGVGIAIERRRYVPHVTLARLNWSSGPINDWLAMHSMLATPAWQVERFHLMESTLHPGGARYTSIADYPLDSG